MNEKHNGGMITDRLLSIAESEDIPVFGMGSSMEMENALAGSRPTDMLPGARSMLCFAVPVPRAVYEAPTHRIEAIWRAQNLYYRRLDTVSLRMAQLLEESGARAVPAYGCCPMAVNGKGEVTGYLNMIRMGKILGVGAIGRNGLLVNTRYGARLMLGGVITTADLPAVRTAENEEPGCPDGCRICADACPAHAIAGKSGRVAVMRCLAHTACTPLMSRLRFGVLTRLDPEAAARLMNRRAFDDLTTHVCSRCITLCPYGRQDGGVAAERPGRAAAGMLHSGKRG